MCAAQEYPHAMTLREALTVATAQLANDEYLRDTATRDAELLLLHTLKIPRITLVAHPDRELTPGLRIAYENNVARRLHHEPIQYITGQQEFYGLDFHVTPAVLIPRPETEHLVEAILQKLPRDKSLKILDVGTGSGILAVTLALHLPNAEVTAIDISADALHVARRNAEAHDVGHRIQFLCSDLLAAVSGDLFDAIVSNPPYVPESDRLTLHPQVRDHEPSTALFAGESGLDIYRRLIPQAYKTLKPGGLLALEIGHGQRDLIAQLLADWYDVTFLDDLQQIPRVALSHRPATQP
jgi:release factor glutamine methyltransferase